MARNIPPRGGQATRSLIFNRWHALRTERALPERALLYEQRNIALNKVGVLDMSKRVMTSEEVAELVGDVPGFKEGQREREAIFLIGEKLREVRKSYLGVSQKEAAHLIGIEQPELSRIETGMGKRGPSLGTIQRILSAYEAYLRETDAAIRVSLNICVSHDSSSEIVLMPLTVS